MFSQESDVSIRIYTTEFSTFPVVGVYAKISGESSMIKS